MTLLFLNIGMQEMALLSLLFIFQVYTLIHIVLNHNLSNKIKWFSLVFFLGFIGWILYWCWGNRPTTRQV